jgi:hypothetical protein
LDSEGTQQTVEMDSILFPGGKAVAMEVAAAAMEVS